MSSDTCVGFHINIWIIWTFASLPTLTGDDFSDRLNSVKSMSHEEGVWRRHRSHRPYRPKGGEDRDGVSVEPDGKGGQRQKADHQRGGKGDQCLWPSRAGKPL